MTRKKPHFVNDVLEWWRSLTPAQQSDVQHWLARNPPRGWQGTPVEYAYLQMPVPEGW